MDSAGAGTLLVYGFILILVSLFLIIPVTTCPLPEPDLESNVSLIDDQ